MKHEAEEQARENDSDISEEEVLDPFVTHGLSSASESDAPRPLTSAAPLARAASNWLHAAKAVQEKLKTCLLEEQDKCAQLRI